MENERFLLLSARKLAGEATGKELLELNELLENNSLFREKYLLFNAYWENNGAVNSAAAIEAAFRETLSKIDLSPEPEMETRRPSLRRPAELLRRVPYERVFLFPKLMKVAAMLLLVAGATYFAYTFYKAKKINAPATGQLVWNEKQTPNGVKSAIILPDNSKVTLNANSKISYPRVFSGRYREVYLSGEAFFDVTKNARQPFIIHTQKLTVKVLGTSFDVKAYPEDSVTEATLIRGSIEVTLKDRPFDKLILKPKERLVVLNATGAELTTPGTRVARIRSPKLLLTDITYFSAADSAIMETSWVNNKLVFRDESFENLAGRMERWYGVSIQFGNGEVKKYRFTGIFENENVKEVLNALRLTENFNYRINGDNILIY